MRRMVHALVPSLRSAAHYSLTLHEVGASLCLVPGQIMVLSTSRFVDEDVSLFQGAERIVIQVCF